MTRESITKLIELLRVFINTPCRTKTDAEVLEAKLAEFEKEVAKPQKREHIMIMRGINRPSDADWFNDQLDECTGHGYTIENCGVHGTGPVVAWAIMSKAEED